MYLYAIGIYEQPVSNEYKRIIFAQKDKSLFAKNELEKLEAITLPPLSKTLAQGVIHSSSVEDEFHYVQAEEDRIIAISSRSPLTIEECGYLFKNINHVYTRPEAVKTTLDNILVNPLGYTGRDILLKNLSESLDTVKITMMENINKILDRHEKIEELEKRTIDLAADAKRFQKTTKKLNRCC